MDKNEIVKCLHDNHKKFIDYTNSLLPNQLEFSIGEKWSAAQQVEHIYKSIRPLSIGLQLPKIIVRLLWGKTNRPSKSYTQLVAKYDEKLALGGKASSPFVPKKVMAKDIKKWQIKIGKSIKRLIKNVEKYSENDFDFYILPHPLLGKITIREMMYFTQYHVLHHLAIIKRDLLNLK